jgi:PBP1b-binding outer membrane lipoprotein LpoB
MSPFQRGATTLIAALLGGCASAPEQASDSPAASATEQAAETLAQNTTESDATVVAAAGAEPAVRELTSADVDPGLVVTCREMLQHASNVITTRCMTADDWKRYEKEEARQAAETVRRFQGDPFP